MYKNIRRQEMIRNVIYIFFILFLVVISTHYIYYKFQKVRSVDFNSDFLDVTYYEETGNKITLSKVTPVTDSVGLSSNAYLISIKNNLTEKVDYKIKLQDDLKAILPEEEDRLIPKDDLRVSIKVNKNDNKIYNLNEVEDGILLEDTIEALGKTNIAIRIWIRQDCSLPMGINMYYHGEMLVTDEAVSNK